MSERIIIEFDDEKDKKQDKAGKPEDRILIEFEDDIDNKEVEETIEVEEIAESYEEKTLKTKFNSFCLGSPYLNYFYESGIKFPEGIENSFRKRFSLNLKDEFFNKILVNNRFVILTSGKGNIYKIDRFTGKVKDKIFIEHESFEKTGLVYDNVIYINSLNKIYRISADGETKNEIYSSENNFLIWSNLSRCKDSLVFTEYNRESGQAALKIIDTGKDNEVSEYKFTVNDFVSDKICIAGNVAYALFDSEVLMYDIDKMKGEIISTDKKSGLRTDESSFIFYLNYRLFITSHLSEIYYLDLPRISGKFSFSGIRCNYINSIGGFDDNIFIGTLDGWKYYKSSGLPVYNYEDEYENRIECISRNVIVVSQKNKIIFCNLNRFQEAESYVISAEKNDGQTEIISAFISGNEIFVITKNGILESFTNDKLNIHI